MKINKGARATTIAIGVTLFVAACSGSPEGRNGGDGGPMTGGTSSSGGSGGSRQWDAGAAGGSSTGGIGAGGAGGESGSGGAGEGGKAGSGGGAVGGGPGQGAPDAGLDTSGCAGLICEDFEAGSIDVNKWSTVVSGGTLSVQATRVAHGKFAMQVHGGPGPTDDWAILVAKNVPSALKGVTTFGRAYVYFPPEGTASIHIQLAFAGRNGTGAGTGPLPFSKLRYMEVAASSGVWQLGFDLLDVSPLVEEVSYSAKHIPTNAWACLEWQLNDDPDTVTAWIDGTLVGTFDNTNVGYASPGPIPKPGAPLYNGTGRNIIGGFDTFGFGFHDWHPQKAFDLYFDDVVLDAKRVGCLH